MKKLKKLLTEQSALFTNIRTLNNRLLRVNEKIILIYKEIENDENRGNSIERIN